MTDSKALEHIPDAADCRIFGPMVRRPWWVVVASLLICTIFALGALRLEVDANARVFLVEGSPEKQALDALEAAYSKDESVVFIVAPPEGDAFTRDVLTLVDEITEAAWRVPYTRRVDSLTNFQHASADRDDIVIADLVENPAAASVDSLQQSKGIALGRPDIAGRLVSTDGRVTTVQLTSSVPLHNSAAVGEIADAVRQIAADGRARHPSIDIRLTGLVMLDDAMAQASDRDAATLVPAMFVVILVIVAVALRSATATAAVLAIIALSVAVALGIAGWWGLKLNPASSAAPIIILTLAVANCVHILTTYRFSPPHTATDKPDAVASAVRLNLKAVGITSATTIVAFLTLNFSKVAPFQELGNIVACGMAAGFFLSITLLPAMMMLLPIRHPSGTGGAASALDSFGRIVVRNRFVMAIGAGAVASIMTLGVLNIEFDDNFVGYFDSSYDFRVDTDFAEERVGGITVYEYSVPAAGTGGISDPEYLRILDRFAIWQRGQDHVGHVLALPDQIKRINEAMNGGDPAERRIPADRPAVAQMLLLYELSLPFGLDLTDRILIDKSASRVTVITDNVSSATTKAMAERGLAWFAENAPPYMQPVPTGLSYTFAFVSERNIKAMLWGSLLALSSISLMLVVAWRSLRLGAISLVPNLLPVFMAFGLWGYLVGQVNLAVSVVGTMTLGIIVDDTVHFLSKYSMARRAGANVEEAVSVAFRSVGLALVVTSVALVAGFGMLALSGFAVNASMGLLAAMTIAIALIADFVLLPALLAVIDLPIKQPAGHLAPSVEVAGAAK